MNKVNCVLVSVFVIISIVFGSLAGIASNSVVKDLPDILKADKTPDDYEPENVFYLCSPRSTSDIKFLSGVPIISDASNPDINLCLL